MGDVSSTRQMDFTSPSGEASSDCPPPTTRPALPGRGEDASDAGLTRLVFPPKVEKLELSQDFNVNDYQMIVPAGVGATVVSAALRFALPKGHIGWLQQFTLYTLTPDASTRLQFTVRINAGPVPGFDNLQNPPGLANFVLVGTDDMRVRLGDSVVVDVLITNLGASGPWTVGGALAGWYHPAVAEKRAWDLNL